MKQNKFTHFCEYEVLLEEQNLTACLICSEQLEVRA